MHVVSKKFLCNQRRVAVSVARNALSVYMSCSRVIDIREAPCVHLGMGEAVPVHAAHYSNFLVWDWFRQKLITE